MNQSLLISEKIIEAINLLQERLYAKHWSEHSRASFIYSLANTINSLNEIKEMLAETRQEFYKEGKNTAEIDAHLKELEKLASLLEQNSKLEQLRAQKAKEKNIELLSDNITNSELYSSLEQKILGFVLKTRFLAERLSIVERKDKKEHAGKASKKVLELLDEKENELHELRKKYEEIKNRHYMARLEEKSSNDLEKDTQVLSKKIEGEIRLLESSIEFIKKSLEQATHSYAVLKEKFGAVEGLLAELSEKNLELCTTLKKERDYAKRIVLDIEHETMRLRNNYSRQVLSLEEEKALAKKEAQENEQKKTTLIAKELREKDELIKNLKEIIHAKEKYVQKLEEQKKSST